MSQHLHRRPALAMALISLLAVLLGCGNDPDAVRPASSEVVTPPDDPSARLGDRARMMRLSTYGQEVSEAELAGLPLAAQARVVGPCTMLTWGGYYCLGLGYRDERPDYDALLATGNGPDTGDLGFRDWVEQRVAMTRSARLEQQRLEVRDAARGLGKARSLATH
jgi:hypothetical protein